MPTIIPTDNIKIKTAFNFIDDSYQRLRKANVITLQNKDLIFSFVKIMKSLFTNILQEIIIFNQEHVVDLEFYSRLFDTDDGNLRVTHLISDDPFFSLFASIKRSLNDVSQLNEMYAEDDPEQQLELEDDSVYKSILYNLRLFYYETDCSICKGYSIKLSGDEKRMKADVRTVIMINKVIEELTNDYQTQLQNVLTPSMLLSPYYSSVSLTYKSLRDNFDHCEFDVNTRFELINTNEINNVELSIYKTNDIDQNYPAALKSESLLINDFEVPDIYRSLTTSVKNEETVAIHSPFKYLIILFSLGIFIVFVMLVKKRN